MRRSCLFAVGLAALTACGSSGSAEFPLGVFQVTFQQVSSNCAVSLQTNPQTVTISVDDVGTYYMTAFGGDTPASSQSAQHATFVLQPTAAQLGTCTYDETDTFTLTAKGQNFTGIADQAYTDSPQCAPCGISQSVVGTKVSN